MRSLEQLRFNLVGYGCTTCIGNSGPLPAAVSQGDRGQRAWSWPAVLQRQPQLRGPRPPRGAGQLPGLAAAGRGLRPGRHASTSTCTTEPLGHDSQGQAGLPEGHLADAAGSRSTPSRKSVQSEMFHKDLRRGVSPATSTGSGCRCRPAICSPGTPKSTYVKHPPYFEDMPHAARHRCSDINEARVLAVLGDSITTDHISPGRLDQEGQSRRANT